MPFGRIESEEIAGTAELRASAGFDPNFPGDDEEQGGEPFIEEGDLLASGPESSVPGTRSWIGGDDAQAAPKAGRDGGTLFERMSNIARGAAKAQVEEEAPAPTRRRDPLDIPRFLGRQNNQ